jgi:hypothetical protein
MTEEPNIDLNNNNINIDVKDLPVKLQELTINTPDEEGTKAKLDKPQVTKIESFLDHPLIKQFKNLPMVIDIDNETGDFTLVNLLVQERGKLLHILFAYNSPTL